MLVNQVYDVKTRTWIDGEDFVIQCDLPEIIRIEETWHSVGHSEKFHWVYRNEDGDDRAERFEFMGSWWSLKLRNTIGVRTDVSGKRYLKALGDHLKENNHIEWGSSLAAVFEDGIILSFDYGTHFEYFLGLVNS